MKNIGTAASAIGTGMNFLLFLIKLYVGISSNCLAVYCDAVNNLGDTVACGIALAGFCLAARMDSRKSNRLQSLCTFVISILIAVTGAYFVYNGAERIMYPLPISYNVVYAYIIAGTVAVKVLMGAMYCAFNKKMQSPVLGALIVDSFLDCFVTLCALMGLILDSRIGFAADGCFAVITGSVITVSAVKTIVNRAKFLIND